MYLYINLNSICVFLLYLYLLNCILRSARTSCTTFDWWVRTSAPSPPPPPSPRCCCCCYFGCCWCCCWYCCFSCSCCYFCCCCYCCCYLSLLLLLLLYLIIWRDRPLANNNPEWPASCKGLSVTPRHPSHICQDPDSISRTFPGQIVLVAGAAADVKQWWANNDFPQVYLCTLTA